MPKTPSKTSKKKKYNSRFPPARIKKIMQTDEEVGKVAAAVPVIISRALEMFIESLIMETSQTTVAKNAKTLSTSHIKQTIESKKQFDFLRDLVSNVPDHQHEDNNGDILYTDGDITVKKGRGRPKNTRKQARTNILKGESSKASTESSEEEEEEDDEETETDEEGQNAVAENAATTSTSVSYLPPSSSSGTQFAINAYHDRLTQLTIPVTSDSDPAAHNINQQDKGHKQEPASVEASAPGLRQPLGESSYGSMLHPPYGPPNLQIPGYPLPPRPPPQSTNSIQSALSSRAHEKLQGLLRQKHNTNMSQQQEPINLSYSSMAQPSKVGADDDDYDS